MKKIVERFLVFLIGLPLVLALVLFLPQRNHLALNLAVVFFSGAGALECAAMLRKKGIAMRAVEAAVLGALCPVTALLQVSFGLAEAEALFPAALALGAAWVLVSGIFSNAASFPGFLCRFSAGAAVIAYPGIFISWLIRMNAWPRASIIVTVFLFMVIVNDSAAWAGGMLFGAGNKGLFAASPNKSVAGFIGGALASVAGGLIATGVFPEVFHSVPAAVALGLLGAAAADLGDLAESVMKRSAAVKDSGALILGRGGALDSIDSIAFASPVFYFSYLLLFG